MSITGRTHPADRAVCAPTSIATMPLADLQAADIELAHRAIQLGKPGQVSRPHQAVKNAIAAANTTARTRERT